MEIGIVASRYPAGLRHDAARAAHSLASGLAALGHMVTVYTYNSTRVTMKQLENKNLKVISVGIPAVKAGLNFEDAEAWNDGVWDELAHEDTTKILLVFDWYGFDAACKHRSEYGSLVIGVVGTLINGKGYYVPFTEPTKLEAYKAKELEFLLHSDSLLAFNECAGAEISKLVDTPYKVIHLGVEELLQEDRLGVKQGSVLVVGRISRDKVLEALLRGIVTNYWIDLTVCGAGINTDYGKYITKLVTKLELEGRVKFVDGITSDHYKKAEIVICPSIYDPFGYAAYDAANYGVPVIGHNSSYADVIKHKDTGWRYQSVPELSQALNTLHNSRSMRKQLALSAKAELAEQYTKVRSIERVDHLLTMLTEGAYAKDVV
jgi:glycosyltransferase involved in cell wall biosynthesis